MAKNLRQIEEEYHELRKRWRAGEDIRDLVEAKRKELLTVLRSRINELEQEYARVKRQFSDSPRLAEIDQKVSVLVKKLNKLVN